MSSIETSLDNTLTELQNENDRNDGKSPEFASNTSCTPVTQSFPPQKKKKKMMMTPFQETLLDAIKNPSHRPIETEDADKAFLMSFLPEIKNLNPEQKSELKFQFHQCVRNISQYNNIPQYSQSISNFYSPLNYQQAPQPQSSISIPSPINFTQPTYHHSYNPISNPISNNFTQSTDQTPSQSQGYSPFPDPSN